jgi:queuosine precursor transporter
MVTHILANKSTKLFVILAAIFVASALIAEIIGVKIFSLEDSMGIKRANLPIFGGVFSFHLSAGTLLWPVVFIMTDIINEYYGKKGVRFLSFLASILITYGFIIFYIAIGLKPSEFFTMDNTITNPNNAFAGVVGQGLWIIIGSLLAFLIGQLLDVIVFQKIKKITGEKAIWLRATGSTLVSQLIDSYVVLFIAFYLGRQFNTNQGAPWSLHQIFVTGTGNYIYKFGVAILLTPVIYLVHYLIENYLGKNNAAQIKADALAQ